MANFPYYDPLTDEAQSSVIAGLSNAVAKLSATLNLQTDTFEDLEMEEIYISEDDRRRIYQVSINRKGWLESPAPIFKKNGNVITASADSFEINYLGGSIEFLSTSSRPSDTDVITVSATYITNASDVIETINTAIDSVAATANKYRGTFTTVSELDNITLPTNGDYAIVLGSVNNIYIYSSTGWQPVGKETDLTGFYTSAQTDTLLATKENTVNAHGATATSDDYYYSGRKTWLDLYNKVRTATLTDLSTATSSTISETDTVLSALGKLQAQQTVNASGITLLESKVATNTQNISTNATNITNNTTSIEKLEVYDVIIKTQAEFDALIASPTWLNATSVLLNGTFSVSNTGITIPSSVKIIHGINAVINVTATETNCFSGFGYSTLSADGQISNVTVNLTSSDWVQVTGVVPRGLKNFGIINNCKVVSDVTPTSDCYYNCTNVYNSYAENDAYGATGFNDCENLVNCSAFSSGLGSGAKPFTNCKNLINCIGASHDYSSGATESEIASVFTDCENLVNCGVLSGTGITDDGNLYSNCFNITPVNENLIADGGFQVWLDGEEFDIETSGWTANYTATMWRGWAYTEGTEFAVLKTDNGIKLQTDDIAGLNIIYTIDADLSSFLRGKKVTFTLSTLQYSDKYHLISYKLPSDGNFVSNEISRWYTTEGINTLTVEIPSDMPDGANIMIILSALAGEDAEFEYIKMELGETATPYIKESYADALAKTQRYFQIYSTNTVDDVDLRPNMRVSPTKTARSDSNYNYDARIY